MLDADTAWARASVKFWLRRWLEQTAAEMESEARRLGRAAAQVRRWA